MAKVMNPRTRTVTIRHRTLPPLPGPAAGPDVPLTASLRIILIRVVFQNLAMWRTTALYCVPARNVYSAGPSGDGTSHPFSVSADLIGHSHQLPFP